MGFEQEAFETLLANVMSKRSLAAKHYSRYGSGEPFVLRHLRKQGTSTPSQLASALRSSSGRISAVLSSLEKKGFVTREVDVKDRRNILVSITDTGLEQALKDRDEARSAICWIFTQMGERRTRDFVDLVTEFHVYMSICKPGEPRPTREEIEKAFASLPHDE
ncbi:MarR family winged helix-turn-helix transcriptional regulator [Bifidobacterium subtile]|jgi:DNA-binding MarR family transcriptional regulator|uniref:MarR family transcriptional regulator n=1 Tax=Bifidobacterium subtile TaxID=77635 RepID=A0A087E7P4_9BIFI|nr:MarR family transcriptional regulator [Bifidobacterium subtile]KFJ03795.1 MarR family transcriptional regulator [Bifidobacterium subtile]MCI1222923.1 MarR family transcriptional regulator [Bifidobacterium subtile]MCI1241550.1 MarR family transcriptional regulator [Bifidobacterium subtile]MCI1258759.1 MarR family transcriptional regulator [Bifidobacterium subtile]QOL36137.1 MarR family transcriptional regulator [Bifidobacterium subtile]